MIPEHVIHRLFNTKGLGVCEEIATLIKNDQIYTFERLRDPESNQKIIKSEDVNHLDSPPPAKFQTFVNRMRPYAVRMSTVDLDNDGIRDIRLNAYVGSASCARDLFFRRDDRGMLHDLPDQPAGEYGGEEGSRCGGDSDFSFFQSQGINYLMIGSERSFGVFRFDRNLDLVRQCTIAATFEDNEPETDCTVPVCHFLTERLPRRQEISWIDQRETVDLPDRLSDFSHSWAKVDVDNDGKLEYWATRKGGRGYWLSYEIWKYVDGILVRVDGGNGQRWLDSLYRNLDLIDTSSRWRFPQEETLNLLEYGGQVYFVAYVRNEETLYRKFNSYLYKVYVIRGQDVERVGTIATFSRPHVSIDGL